MTTQAGERRDLPVLARKDSVHAQVLRPRGVHRAARANAAGDVAFRLVRRRRHPEVVISRLNGWPARTPVNASPSPSQTPAHDSGPSWIATPSMSGVLIPFLPPVYPGAPHVPRKSPDQTRAAYMPDAIWAVGRLPPDLSRSPALAPVSTPMEFITTRHQRFAHARLPDPHLTRSLPRLLPQRSPRPALNRRSLRWFGASPCRATPEDLPPSLTQHRFQRPYITQASFSVRGTRTAETDSVQVLTMQLSAVRVSSSPFSADACSTSAPPPPDKDSAV